jgi:hypothetical protein
VVVPILEIRFVQVRMGMGRVVVSMVVFDVIMLVAGVRVGVARLAIGVGVGVVMWSLVLVDFGHLFASILVGLGLRDGIGEPSGGCR